MADLDGVDLDHVDDLPSSPPADIVEPDGDTVEWTRVDWYSCLGIVLAAVALVSLHVLAYPTVSPVDETQHIDYMIKAGDLEIPNLREQIGQEALREVACRTIDFPDLDLPPCGLPSYDPTEFPDFGFNTATGQFPIYYVLTGVTAGLLAELPGIDSQVTAGRLVGALWLGAALCVLWYVYALFGIPRLQRAIMTALTMATPLVIFHSSTINPDAVLLFTGSVVLLATLQFERGRLPWWGLLGVVTAFVLVEPTNLLPGALAIGYLLFRVTIRRDETPIRRAVPFLALAGLLIVRSALYDRLREALPAATDGSNLPSPGRGRPAYQGLRVDEVSIERVVSQVASLFTPLDNLYRPPHFAVQYIRNVLDFTDWLLIGLLIAALIVYVGQRRSMTLAGVTIATLLAAGPLYTFYYAYFSGLDFAAPGRFGLPLIPALMVAAATAIRTRAAVIVSGTVAGAVVVTTVVALLAA
jgi:hypothetical protein